MIEERRNRKITLIQNTITESPVVMRAKDVIQCLILSANRDLTPLSIHLHFIMCCHEYASVMMGTVSLLQLEIVKRKNQWQQWKNLNWFQKVQRPFQEKRFYTAEVGTDTTNIEEGKVEEVTCFFCLLVFAYFSLLYNVRLEFPLCFGMVFCSGAVQGELKVGDGQTYISAHTPFTCSLTLSHSFTHSHSQMQSLRKYHFLAS